MRVDRFSYNAFWNIFSTKINKASGKIFATSVSIIQFLHRNGTTLLFVISYENLHLNLLVIKHATWQSQTKPATTNQNQPKLPIRTQYHPKTGITTQKYPNPASATPNQQKLTTTAQNQPEITDSNKTHLQPSKKIPKRPKPTTSTQTKQNPQKQKNPVQPH